ncbi:hypothetical protein [Thiorhodococcus fuscus]|uniref:Response regulator n=1 Tax=Thiorhodococcus fuscus TaxID=527200 RepID=A0ABW4YB06_9GAMM
MMQQILVAEHPLAFVRNPSEALMAALKSKLALILLDIPMPGWMATPFAEPSRPIPRPRTFR